MRKKLLIIMLLTTLAISFTACGGQQQAPHQETAETQVKQKVPEETKAIQTRDLDLTVLEEEVFAPGEIKGQYTSNETPVVVITYELTNKKSEPLNAQIGWHAVATITQETKDTIEDLLFSTTYNDHEKYGPLFEMLNNDVKPGGTVQAAVIYEIKYPGEPIRVDFTKGFAGEDLGSFTIETSKLV